MSILIKGMEMPENCYQCRFYNSPCAQCRIIGRTYMNMSNQPSIRPEWCPVVQVPTPHGRLIDVKALERMDFSNWIMQGDVGYVPFMEVAAAIFNAPTVIEAEVEE